jgi:hypothetical protein
MTASNARRRNRVNPRARRPGVEELEGRLLLSTVFGLTTSNGIFTFDTTTPAQVSAATPVAGLAAGDSLEALSFLHGADFQGANPFLALARNGSQGRLYVIDAATRQATPLGSPFTLNGTAFDLAVTDTGRAQPRAVVSSDAGAYLDVDPTTGAVTPDAGQAAALGHNVAGVAFDSGVHGDVIAPPTLYGYRFDTNQLVTVTPATARPTGLVAQSARDLGLDLRTDDRAFASVRANGSTNLYRIDPDTGAATLVGPIGDGSDTVRDIVLAQPAVIGFEQSSPLRGAETTYVAREADGMAVLPVLRTGDTSGAVSVTYAITGGSAVAGVNFSGPTSGTLTFGDGETSKTITIPLIRNGVPDPTRTIEVILDSPTRDADIATNIFFSSGSATVVVLDSDGGGGTIIPGTTVRDVTSMVRVARVRGGKKGGKAPGRVRVKVTNPGSDPLVGPLMLVVGDLPRGVRLRHAAGRTRAAAPAGRSFVRVPLGGDGRLAPGESKVVNLSFSTRPGKGPGEFATQVLAGEGTP